MQIKQARYELIQDKSSYGYHVTVEDAKAVALSWKLRDYEIWQITDDFIRVVLRCVVCNGHEQSLEKVIRMTKAINTPEYIDSRDVIARIEDLERDEESLDTDEIEELVELRKLAKECENVADWQYGESLIREDAFTDHIKELINDCYDLPKEFNSGEWPWRYVKIDYEAAAEEAKADYTEVTYKDENYLIRDC
jgi:hypothetical protein